MASIHSRARASAQTKATHASRAVISHMRTHIFIILRLLISLNRLYGQVDLNDSIVDFNSNCSEPITPEDNVAEFTLLELSTKENSTTLNFEIIANCAQQKQGLVTIRADSIIILETDMTITRTTRYEEADSAGLTLEITEETYLAEIASCDCLVNFYYLFSAPLDNVNFLTFHERTFKLNGVEKNAR
jgi:hypothetical protein